MTKKVLNRLTVRGVLEAFSGFFKKLKADQAVIGDLVVTGTAAGVGAATGSYMGTDPLLPTQAINLGLQPKYVRIVSPNSTLIATADVIDAEQPSIIRRSLAGAAVAALGEVTITPTGFSVTGGVMNQGGITFFFMAGR